MSAIDEFLHKFSGRLVGKPMMKTLVCETVALLPKDLADYVTKKVWFLSSPEDAWAYTFRGDDVGNQHLIVLSDELFAQDKEDIQYTIIHEIGHVILGHQNSIDRKQTQSEIDKQEHEADSFARRYLNG